MKWIKLLVANIFIIVLLNGCSFINENNKQITLKLWVGLNQGETYREIVEEFEEVTNIKVNVIEVLEADNELLKDSEVAADVILINHDQLGQIVEADTVYKNQKYVTETKNENIPLAIQAATYKEILYGYPVSADAMFLYYDKQQFNKDDLKFLDTMLEKGKIGLNIAETGAVSRLTPWFIANGAYLFGVNGDDIKGTTLNNDKGLNVLKWVAEVNANSNLVPVNAEEINAFQEGRISALFSGYWNAQNIKSILGENMGTSVYPKADFGNGEINLKAFTNVQIFIVNAATKHPSEAMDLAKFITNKDSQMKVFQKHHLIPTNKKARETKVIQNDEIARVIAEMTTDEYSVLMPKLPEIMNFWPNMNAILVDAYEGRLSEKEMQDKMDKLVNDISLPLEE